MRIKSYFASSVAEAINKARQDLGPEAMIVASRRTGDEATHLGAYEVVCGVHQNEELPATQAASQSVSAPPPVAAAPEEHAPKRKNDGFRQGFSRMRKGLENWKGGAREQAAQPVPAPEFNKAERLLASSGFEDDLLDEVMAGVRQRFRQTGDASLDTVVAEELADRIMVDSNIGRPRAERKVMALVGPPGVGKTTTLVKLAVKYGLMSRKPVHLITMDSYRIAKADQLRTYAAAMGVTIDVVETVATLSERVDEHASKGLVLLDTAGLGPNDMGGSDQLSNYLSRHPEIDVNLVLPAFMSAQNMAATAQRFKPFLASKILFTNMDSAGGAGAAIATALRMDRPVSFLCAGQEIPEDIIEATPSALISRWLPSQSRKAASAA